MPSTFTFLVATTLMGVVYSYSAGAPEGVCDDMTPKHGVDPQTSPIPYTISIDKDKVKPGEQVKITINGKESFKGYLLQVRDGSKAVGTFKIPTDDKYRKAINCHNSKQTRMPLDKIIQGIVEHFMNMLGLSLSRGPRLDNAATHKNSADKQNLSVLWEAPQEKKTYTVYATVAKDGGVFWVRKPSGTITVQ